jgi:glycosyltransferase involved in cell wall biosynthesis
MLGVGNVLVDLDGMPPGTARSYLLELRERLGPIFAIDARWARGHLADIPPDIRLLRHASGADALARAGLRAAERGHLVVMLAPLLPDPAALQGLLEAFETDPLVGFAEPRFGNAPGDGVWFLPDAHRQGGLLGRQSLSLLPEHYLTTEHLAGCLAVRREIAAVFSTGGERLTDLRAALLLELCHARRRGFRNLVMNRVVIPTGAGSSDAVYPRLDPSSRRELLALCKDAAMGEEWFDDAPHHQRERLVSQARRPRPTARIPVLLDARGASPQHNGTSHAMLGMLDGLVVDMPAWDLEVLVGADASRYHDLGHRYPTIHFRTALPEEHYAAAVCLGQPWHLSTIAELHRRAATIGFNMLDTIAWDIVYMSNPEVEKAWSFIAEHADGLLYISRFTQDRFNFRFPAVEAVVQSVTHLSLEPSEYRDSRASDLSEGAHLLVFGNYYEHKAVAPTIELLSRAFPFQPIWALGAREERRGNVTVLESGHLPELEIDRLIATARAVVFPSYYEGFGLPVVKALAYGRTVVVRSSPLWHELAALTVAPGRLVEFQLPHELVATVGKVVAQEELNPIRFGTDLTGGRAPPRWRDCARALADAVEEMVLRTSFSRWQARDRALRLAQL